MQVLLRCESSHHYTVHIHDEKVPLESQWADEKFINQVITECMTDVGQSCRTWEGSIHCCSRRQDEKTYCGLTELDSTWWFEETLGCCARGLGSGARIHAFYTRFPIFPLRSRRYNKCVCCAECAAERMAILLCRALPKRDPVPRCCSSCGAASRLRVIVNQAVVEIRCETVGQLELEVRLPN